MTAILSQRKHTPTVLQMEAVECGAAALAMILGHYGLIVPLAELRQRCGVSRDGSKASNVVKAARLYGMTAKGYSKSLEDVKTIRAPFIVFWQFDHFLVVEGWDRKYVYLNDPALGHRQLTWDEFDAGFTGVVLVMEPGDDFEKGGRAPSPVTGILQRMQGNTIPVLFCAIAGILMVLPGLAIPTFSRIYIDSIIIDGRFGWFRPLLIAMAGTVVLKIVLQGVQQLYTRRLQLSLSARLNSQFFWHLMRLPAGFYAQRFPGEIVGRMGLNSKVSGVIAGQLIGTLIDLFTMLIYGAVLMLVSVPLTLIAGSFAAINIAYLRRVAKSRIEANLRYSQHGGKLDGVTIAGIQSIETMKASGMESGFFDKWAGYFTKMSNAGQELQQSTQGVEVIPIVVDTLTTVLILIVGGYNVIQGSMTIGTLVAYQGLMGNFLAPIQRLTSIGTTLQELRGDLLRLDDVLGNPPSEMALAQTPPSDGNSEKSDSESVDRQPATFRLDGRLELRDVTFGYSPLDPPLIQDFSLKVEPGQRIALVGGSGSGKSTVAKLICGLYEPWTGEILFDGRRRESIKRDVLCRSLAMVEQDVFMFEGTVRENLTLWNRTIPTSDLERACRDAHIHDVVGNMPGAYSARLSEGATNLSGGQRQRLEIARSLVNNPAILVLDEATSALDSETEAILDSNLRRRGCTCVIVAHRLSTIRDCDEIIVMDRGQVIERGTHEQLWKSGGLYAELLRHQDGTQQGTEAAMA